jgi:hypothetical protein
MGRIFPARREGARNGAKNRKKTDKGHGLPVYNDGNNLQVISGIESTHREGVEKARKKAQKHFHALDDGVNETSLPRVEQLIHIPQLSQLSGSATAAP